MPKFRKIPVEIEAWQWTGQRMGEMTGVCQCDFHSSPHVHTAHENSIDGSGQMVFLTDGDWIIPESGKPNRFYPCKPDIFAKTYEPVERRIIVAAGDAAVDPATPTCKYCGARVYEPCSNYREELRSVDCELPPGTIYVDDRRSRMIGGPGVAISEDDPRHPHQRYTRFRDRLQNLINFSSMENGSDTPDFILAEMLTANLRAFDELMQRRDSWYGSSSRLLKSRLDEGGAMIEALCAQVDASNKRAADLQGRLASEGQQFLDAMTLVTEACVRQGKTADQSITDFIDRLGAELDATKGKYLQMFAHARQVEEQLAAEGEHTAAANSNIDRLNTEIERITRRQQGVLAEHNAPRPGRSDPDGL